MCVSVTVSVPCRGVVACVSGLPLTPCERRKVRCGSLRHAKETIFGPVNYAVRATDGVFPFLLHVSRRGGRHLIMYKYETVTRRGGPRHRAQRTLHVRELRKFVTNLQPRTYALRG